MKIGVFLSPVILTGQSMFGFNIFKRDIPHLLMWLYHTSYFRASIHGMMDTIYHLRRPELPCPADMLYCHYRYTSKFLMDIDIIDVNVTANLAMICGMGMLMFSVTVLSIWIQLYRQ